MARKKPQFAEDAQQCITAAKVVARGEGSQRLDPVHIVRAALAVQPEATRRALADRGIKPEHLGDVAVGCELYASADASLPAMPLVAELRELVYGGSLADAAAGKRVSAETLIAALLRHPSFRLKTLLRNANVAAPTDDGHSPDLGGAEPYASLRQYIIDSRHLWTLRRSAAQRFVNHFRTHAAHEAAWLPEAAADRLLDSLARLEDKIGQRAAKTPQGKVALLDIRKREGLPKLDGDLVDGVFVHELYGLGDYPGEPLSVRRLTQMVSPEVFPRGCAEVLEAVDGLSERDILKWRGPSDVCTLDDRVYLSARTADELYGALSRDPISNDDFNALTRRLRLCPHWPPPVPGGPLQQEDER